MRSQRGNVLFLILIAVALFAALSFAVTQSTRGGGNADEETSLINSTNVTQFGSTIVNAINRMMLFDGVGEADLCFYTGNNHADYNHASCATTRNNVFLASGGSVLYQNPPNNISSSTEWEFTSVARLMGHKNNIFGDAASTDLLMVLRDVNQNICEKINEKAGISGIPVDSGNLDLRRFDGGYSGVDTIDGCNPNCGSVAASPVGNAQANIGCVEEEDTGEYIYFHLLLAR